eukprot:2462333-Prymnesium_polylepis.5
MHQGSGSGAVPQSAPIWPGPMSRHEASTGNRHRDHSWPEHGERVEGSKSPARAPDREGARLRGEGAPHAAQTLQLQPQQLLRSIPFPVVANPKRMAGAQPRPVSPRAFCRSCSLRIWKPSRRTFAGPPSTPNPTADAPDEFVKTACTSQKTPSKISARQGLEGTQQEWSCQPTAQSSPVAA